VIVTYGMTLGPVMNTTMGAVLKNIDIKGSTMGSRKEFFDMVNFTNEKNLRPVISRVVQGLDMDKIDSLFQDMKSGSQFGKLVVEVSQTKPSKI
jgi:D-arabinose 1-dehydrogenase-like Zn-dependent alcohol dehydrogenase